MNKKDKELMDKYHITSSTKVVFHYKGYKYDDLDKAVSYAEHEARRLNPVPADTARH